MFPDSIILKHSAASILDSTKSDSAHINGANRAFKDSSRRAEKGRAVDRRHRNLKPHTTAICQQIRTTLSGQFIISEAV